MNGFVAYEVSLELIRELVPVLAAIKVQDAGLAKQMREAGSSVALNLAEGWRRAGGDRVHSFRIASGSASEVKAGLDVALAWGWVGPATIERAHAVADRELRLIHGLRHRRA